MPIQNNRLMKTILTLPTSNFRQFILDLAVRNNIAHTRTVGDAWAAAVTRISGDDVHTNEIDGLLVALKIAGVISSHEMILLLVGYMRESKAT